MKIKVHSNDLNRMMKVIGQCLDPKHQAFANVEIRHDGNQLTVRSTNGSMSARMSTPLLGGDGEAFCVDGGMFQKVCAICSGMIEIITEGKNCIIKGSGRTRLPIVSADIPEIDPIDGQSVTVESGDFSKCYGKVAYAVSSEQTRLILTGICTETDGSTMRMVALDGFQMSIEKTRCEGDAIKVVIPNQLARLIARSVLPGDKLTLKTDGRSIIAETDDMMLKGALLAGEYIDYQKIMPETFGTEVRLKAENVINALKSGSAVNSKQHLIKLNIETENVRFMSNSEQASYEADVACETQGKEMNIAFNERFLMNAMSTIDSGDSTVLCLNSPVSPAVVRDMETGGKRLLLPVRVMGE